MTYTFTNYNKYEDIKSRLTLYSYIDKKTVPNETSLNLTFATAGKETSQNVTVDYKCNSTMVIQTFNLSLQN
ncbi:hypothetical protein ACVNPZ_08505 [Staphylococcus aureus]